MEDRFELVNYYQNNEHKILWHLVLAAECIKLQDHTQATKILEYYLPKNTRDRACSRKILATVRSRLWCCSSESLAPRNTPE